LTSLARRTSAEENKRTPCSLPRLSARAGSSGGAQRVSLLGCKPLLFIPTCGGRRRRWLAGRPWELAGPSTCGSTTGRESLGLGRPGRATTSWESWGRPGVLGRTAGSPHRWEAVRVPRLRSGSPGKDCREPAPLGSGERSPSAPGEEPASLGRDLGRATGDALREARTLEVAAVGREPSGATFFRKAPVWFPSSWTLPYKSSLYITFVQGTWRTGSAVRYAMPVRLRRQRGVRCCGRVTSAAGDGRPPCGMQPAAASPPPSPRRPTC
jgi:hypothetical protein